MVKEYVDGFDFTPQARRQVKQSLYAGRQSMRVVVAAAVDEGARWDKELESYETGAVVAMQLLLGFGHRGWLQGLAAKLQAAEAQQLKRLGQMGIVVEPALTDKVLSKSGGKDGHSYTWLRGYVKRERPAALTAPEAAAAAAAVMAEAAGHNRKGQLGSGAGGPHRRGGGCGGGGGA